MVDPETFRCTGLIDLGCLGTVDQYADLALLIGNARESWAGHEDIQTALHQFAGLNLERISDETTIPNFRRLLERQSWQLGF